MASKTVSTRLEAHELELLESLGRLSGLDRAGLIRSLLKRGLDEMRLELAVKQYREEKATLSRTAEIAGIGLWDLVATMKPLGLELHIDDEEFERDLQASPRPA
jgi:predicted HTH domain antitoxin